MLALLISLLLVFGPPSLQAQEAPEIPSELLESALSVSFEARVTSAEKSALWREASQALTLPGKPIAVNMEASNFRLLISLTPYQAKDGNFVLVVQSQVWMTGADKSVMYHSSVNTSPLPKGQRLTLYPLGRPKDGSAALSLEVGVVPYRETEAYAVRTSEGTDKR